MAVIGRNVETSRHTNRDSNTILDILVFEFEFEFIYVP
jgi:hypothetical protein